MCQILALLFVTSRKINDTDIYSLYLKVKIAGRGTSIRHMPNHCISSIDAKNVFSM